MKIVLDTNCLLQILGAKSKYAFLLDKFIQGEYTLCISSEILLEYEEIIKAKASPVAADLFMKLLSRSRNVIRKDPYFRLRIIKQDNDDNKFTDCAYACDADAIVTNDNHFADAAQSPFPTFNVVSLDDFTKLLKP